MTNKNSRQLLDGVYDKTLGRQLALIEELREILGDEGIECPGILVIGSQSAGKSSVLERLTGIPFPRGENTCTRMPTIVQMQTDSSIDSPFGLVSVNASFQGSTKCNTLTEIENAIRETTNSKTNKSSPILDEPIHIRYVRTYGPVMTMIDLPGITHVDPSNIGFDVHAATSDMVKKYASNKSMIMLVVIPANDDFSNAEALRIAQSYDPNGERTIGVVSKCDLVPAGSDIVKKIRMARESDVKLALGFVAVRNKGPLNASENVENEEHNLFHSHPELKHLRASEWGYKSLTQKVVKLQSKQVISFLPKVKRIVQSEICKTREKLNNLGEMPLTPSERRISLSTEVAFVCSKIQSYIRAEECVPEMNIASQTNKMAFQFSKSVEEEFPDFLCEKYRELLDAQMREMQGYSLPNFMSDTVFRQEMQKVLSEKRVPLHVHTLIVSVRDLLYRVVQSEILERNELAKYNLLTDALIQKSNIFITEGAEEAENVTKCILKAERAQLFTQNIKYINAINEAYDRLQDKCRVAGVKEQWELLSRDLNRQDLQMVSAKIFNKPYFETVKISEWFIEKYLKLYRKSKDLVSRATFELQLSLKVYSDIVKDRLFDIIPMIARCIVHDVHGSLHVRLASAFSDEDLEKMYIEDDSTRSERSALVSTLNRLQSAAKKLESFWVS